MNEHLRAPGRLLAHREAAGLIQTAVPAVSLLDPSQQRGGQSCAQSWLRCIAGLALAPPAAKGKRHELREGWPLLRSTFPSTGGGGITIKGYDPVITDGKCMTTFMAVEPGEDPNVYRSVVEFEAVPAQGGTLCQNGRWRAPSTAAPPAPTPSYPRDSSRTACSAARPDRGASQTSASRPPLDGAARAQRLLRGAAPGLGDQLHGLVEVAPGVGHEGRARGVEAAAVLQLVLAR